jgi:CHAT domain-containing protein
MQMMNLKNEIYEVLQIIEQTTALFYQQKNKEGYQALDQTLNRLIQTIDTIYRFQIENNQIYIEKNALNTVLEKAMTAIEQGDMILLSDILIFELEHMLLQCYENIN